jgi:hypothetical protein
LNFRYHPFKDTFEARNLLLCTEISSSRSSLRKGSFQVQEP